MGKEPYPWLRLYDPEDAFWNETFQMPDVELVKGCATKRKKDRIAVRRVCSYRSLSGGPVARDLPKHGPG
jgi:hypothetical protein